MPWVQCIKCHYIRESRVPAGKLNGTYRINSPGLPRGAYCINCGDENNWQDYKGPLAPTILGNERKTYTEIEVLCEQKKTMIASLGATRKNKVSEFEANFSKRFKSDETVFASEVFLSLHTEIQLFFDLIVSMTEELAVLDRKLGEMTKPGIIERDAAIVAGNASRNASGGLILGNRQLVSVLSPAKILDATNWSWGLNIAWVEGGVHGKADFELVLNANNPFHTLPPVIINLLQIEPNMSCDKFLTLCKEQGSGSLLWYDADGENRPTWTALEVATLLRMGYTFAFQGEHIYLRKPAPPPAKR